MSFGSERGLATNLHDVQPSQPDRLPLTPQTRKLAWRVAFRVALIAFVAFAGILDNGFVAWDDMDNFPGNTAYQGLGSKQIYWAWTTFWMGVYQPIGWMLAELQYATSGLNPRGYHLASLFLHMACAVALYVLTFTLLGPWQTPDPARAGCERDRFILAGLITTLFAVHPLRVEPVAWVSGQAYLPCALFAMLSVLCYLWAHGAGGGSASRFRAGWLAFSIALFALSLLSKAASLGLPCIFLILDFYPLRRLGTRQSAEAENPAWYVWLEKVPYLALSLVFGVIAVIAKRSDQTLVNVEQTGPMGRLALASYSAWFYLIKTLWPTNLHAFPMRPEPLDWTEGPYVFSMLGIVVVSAVLYRWRNRNPAWLAAWIAYLTLLAPMSGLVTYGRQAIGDRYSYLPMIPWVTLLAGGLWQWWSPANLANGRPLHRWLVCFALAPTCLAMLMFLTWRQCQSWEDSGTLWAHSIHHGGAKVAELHNNLGIWRAKEGDFDAAISELKQAIWLRPDCQESYVNLAHALGQKGQLAEAVATLRAATWRWPEDIYIRGLLGKTLFHSGHFAEAAEQYKAISRLQPEKAFSHCFLGHVLAREGRYAEAASQYAEALRIDPGDQEAQRGLHDVQQSMKPSHLPEPATSSLHG